MNKEQLNSIMNSLKELGMNCSFDVSGQNLLVVNKNQQCVSFYDMDVSKLPIGVKYAIAEQKVRMRLYPACVFYVTEEKPEFSGARYIIPFHDYKLKSGECRQIRLEQAEAEKFWNQKLTLIGIQEEIKTKN